MRKQLTGEPVAGELHTGFGGRGRRKPFPTPILRLNADIEVDVQATAVIATRHAVSETYKPGRQSHLATVR